MRIGFPFDEKGKGGVRSWVKTFSQYCVQKGHEVFYTPDADVDIFITIANTSTLSQIERLKAKGTKIIQRMDGIFFDYFMYTDQSAQMLNEGLINSMTYADLVVYQSKFSEEVSKYILKDKAVPGTIIYNGIDTELFAFRGECVPRNRNKKLVLSIAYWGTPKMAEFSIKTIIETARLLQDKDYEFWILGEAYAETETLIREANLPNITQYSLRKPVPHTEIPKYIRTADLILHTRPHDACSNLILEAVNMHKPVVGLDSGSTPELLEGCGLIGKCEGRLDQLPQVDYANLAEQIVTTFENYEEYVKKIIERSKVFSQEIMSENYLREMEKLIGVGDETSEN